MSTTSIVQTLDASAYTADLRRAQACEAIAHLIDADLGPLSVVLVWLPSSVRALAVVAALRFLAGQPALLQVAQLTPKQIAAVQALADDAFGAVSAPLIGGWLRKLGPVLKKTLGLYDPATVEKGQASEDQLVNLLAKAMTRAAGQAADTEPTP